MPIPTNLIDSANIIERILDPHGRLMFTIEWGDFLDPTNTTIASAQMVLSAEAAAAGMTVERTTWEGTDVSFWLSCSSATNEIFDGDGVTFGVLSKIEDTLDPLSQKAERTIGVLVRQR